MVELESWLQKHRQQVDQILRATETSDLLLILLVSFLLLGLSVNELFISDEPHLFGIAILDIKSILTLEKHIPGKVLGHLALILLLKVDEGLLGSRNNLDLRHFSLRSG